MADQVSVYRTVVELLSDPEAPSSVLERLPDDYVAPAHGGYERRRWWHWQDRAGARARLKRRAYPIAAYVGPNGTGKSWLMVYDTIPSLLARRFVLSTVRITDFEDPRPCPGGDTCDDPAGHFRLATVSVPDPATANGVRRFRYRTGEVHPAAHPYYVPFRDYTQLLSAVDCDILMDEVTGVASSREIASMPVQVANFLVQLRRRNLTLRWTAPSWGRADKIIREVSQGVTLMTATMPKRHPVGENEAPRLWTDKRLFTARTYDPTQMEEFEAHRADHIPHEVWAMYWRPWSMTDLTYDTFDAVTSLGWANDAGLCMSCGGKRSHVPCSCDDHVSRKRSAAGGRPKAVPAAPVPLPAPPPLPLPVVPAAAAGGG